jgi:peptide-methionine (S)-S-oxide reductase
MQLRILCFLLLTSLPMLSYAETAKAIFAGGCFWCMESNYQDIDGVVDVVSGFSGGELKNPTYQGNHKGHYEAVEVTYDPSTISYDELLTLFWHSIDPFDNSGQFCDKGASYRSAIFTSNSAERELAIKSLDGVNKRFPAQTVATEILDAKNFWPVEEAHQDYYMKNPVRYKYYRWNCGRDQRVEEIWGDDAVKH